MTEDSPQQDAVLKRMTPGRKWRVAEALFWQARKWKRANLKEQHPDWPEERLQQAVRDYFIHATTD